MIYTGLGRLGEIANVKAHGGADVAEVYGSINELNPIYYKTRTITGQTPLSYKALSKPLSDYLISGNTLQDGTPTPDNPVNVVGCGMKTGNLFDKSTMTANAYLSQIDGQYLSSAGNSRSCIIKIEPRTSYRVRTASQTMRIAFFTQYPQPNNIPTAYYNHDLIGSYATRAFIETSGNTDRYMVVFCYNNAREYVDGKTVDEIMSTVMVSEVAEMSVPYEPYGYKLPLTVNGAEYPIYLGQVPTTRRIKKLVLTGEEDWHILNGFMYIDTIQPDYLRSTATTLICSHYRATGGVSTGSELQNGRCALYRLPSVQRLYIRDDNYTSVTDFVSYLASEYAAGTPVTIWYVLAEPETGIVNEPLHKIGDYADTSSMAQAGVTIPTVAGANTLTVDTTVQPSEVSITGNIKEVST